jgi:very-short-patch-repair endonuclease
MTRSKAERRLLALVRSAGLPAPAADVPLEGFIVDFLWRPERLIVEIDGYEFHGGREAFEKDRARDQKLTAAGYRVIRITWRQLVDRELTVVAAIAGALAHAAQQAA